MLRIFLMVFCAVFMGGELANSEAPLKGVPLIGVPLDNIPPNLRQNYINQYQLALVLNGDRINIPLNSNTYYVTQQDPTGGISSNPTTVNPSMWTKPEPKPNPINQQNGELLKYCLQERGQFPSGYCNKFVNCWSGNAVEQFCPPTLMFNPKGGYCDYPSNVDCQGKPIQAETELTNNEIGSTPIAPSVPSVPSVPSAPSVPSVPSAPSVPVAPPSSSWPSDGSYRPPSNGNSDGSYRPSPPSIGPSGWPSDGSYRPPSSSTASPVPSSTPSVTFTNRPPFVTPVYNITQVSTTTAAPTNVIANELKKYCLNPRGQFPARDCRKFVNCWDDVVIEQECPEGLLFNPAKSYCDFQMNTDCKSTTGTTGATTVAGAAAASNESPCPAPQGTFRNRNNCSQYFTCLNNRIVAQYECPTNYLFNIDLGVCDLAFRVDCSSSNSTPTRSLPQALVNPSMACKPGTIFRLNADCSHVSLCRNGYAEFVRCPGGLSYDLVSDKCTYPDMAVC